MRLKTKEAPELTALVKIVGSKKRSLSFSVCEKVKLYGRYWSGGTKNEYTAIHLKTKKVARASDAWNPMFDVKAVNVPIPEDVVIVQHGWFCGKPATPHIYINPANAAMLLPPGIPHDGMTMTRKWAAAIRESR